VSNKNKIILDLCGGSGAWSKPYLDAGYDVRLITLPEDVRFVHYISDAYGILAAPPCTYFAGSGARWKRTNEQMIEALGIADACLRLVLLSRLSGTLKFWVLEQPIGKLVRWYGKPKMYFQPYEYGDPYTKRTALWGEFNIPVKTPVEPIEGGRIWKMPPSPDRAAKRSITPPGFAKAFFEANQ
jgi:hypothetical protein